MKIIADDNVPVRLNWSSILVQAIFTSCRRGKKGIDSSCLWIRKDQRERIIVTGGIKFKWLLSCVLLFDTLPLIYKLSADEVEAVLEKRYLLVSMMVVTKR